MKQLEAHRGVSLRYPENTLTAFRAALREGYRMIELDPKVTRDGEIVILHDSTVNRTARRADGTPLGQPAAIADLTLAEARALEYGSWKSPDFAGEPLPTLRDVLEFSAGSGIPLKFDNVMQKFAPAVIDRFCQAVTDAGFVGDRQALIGITGNSIDYLAAMHARLPGAHLHYDGPLPAGTDGEAVLNELHALVPPEQLTVWLPLYHISWCPVAPADPDRIAAIRRVGGCGLWIVNAREQIARALELDADWIETDGTMTVSDLV
ncbi:MAG: hypothetical protein MJ192_05240 [Clostridia bacterium]|nr:hypothetical protein [Clostridia bacterium]